MKKSIIPLIVLTGLTFSLAACDNGNKEINISSISADVPETMVVGETKDLTITIEPAEAIQQDYELSSSDPEIVSVSGDKLIANSTGDAIITLKSEYDLLDPVTYSIEVVDLMPTDFNVDIPNEITTSEIITLNLEFVPENATYREFDVSISNEEVLAYDVINKTINPLGVGSSDVIISIPNTDLSKTYNIDVKQGYSAPIDFDSFVDLVNNMKDDSYDRASDISYAFTEEDFEYSSNSSYDRTFKFADDGVSFVGNDADGEDSAKEYGYVAIEDDKFYNLIRSHYDSDCSSAIKTIVEEVSNSYYETTIDDAKKAMKFDVLSPLMDVIDSYFSFSADVFETSNLNNGGFKVHTTSSVYSYGTRENHDVSVEFDKFGRILSANMTEEKYDAESEESEVGDKTNHSSFSITYTYGDKYELNQLDNYSKELFFAKSFDATYESYGNDPLTVEVGDTFSTYNIEVSNVVPATATNILELEVEVIKDDNNILDTSGYSWKFVGEGQVTIKITPRYSFGEEASQTITITSIMPLPTSIANARVDLRSSYLVVGETSTLSATIKPNNALQTYTVTSSDATKASVTKDEKGIWSVTALAATLEGEPVVLTFAADGNPEIKTTVSIPVLSEAPSIDLTTPVGDYTGTITNEGMGGTNDIKVSIIDETNGEVYDADDNNLVFSFTYSFDEATGNLNDVVIDDPNYFYDSDPFTWTYNTETGELNGQFTADYGGYYFNISAIKG